MHLSTKGASSAERRRARRIALGLAMGAGTLGLAAGPLASGAYASTTGHHVSPRATTASGTYVAVT
ncbi:MAG TPA: hypothetical protein VMV02_04020, partial [Acidimicrobiales bacterium]|nr:hypothetical protein [Acidimicrobiales bacterium]